MVVDPIGLALLQKQLDHIARQMGWVMSRTARSPIFSQSHDFSCFIGDRRGNIVSQADGLPIHTGGGSFAIKAVLRAFDQRIDDGDVYILSDPYDAGGNHLPDWTIIRPVMVKGRILAFCCNRAHQSDIGGGAAGTYNAAATEIFHEGIRLPVLRLVDRNGMRDDLWRLLLLNSRCPDLLEGDLQAMIGSTEIGRARIIEAFSEVEEQRAEQYLDAILDHAESLVRAEIGALGQGIYEAEDESDNDCFDTADIRVRVRIAIDSDRINVDFTGSSPQIKGFKNSSLANTHSAVYLAVLSFLGGSLPKNDGAFRPITIVAPEGTIVNARAPAPMTMNTVFPATNIVHACWRALSLCDPSRACAGWGKSLHCITSGPAQDGKTFVMYHWHGLPGSGAVGGRDGLPTMGTVPTLCGLKLANVEAYEQLYPVRILQYEMRCDGGGAGQFRGGTGIDYSAEISVPADYSFRGEAARGLRAFGVNSGAPGGAGHIRLDQEGVPVDAPQYGVRSLGPLHLTIASPGGGGFGDPLRRDPAAVLRDVRDGVVSRACAEESYGVVLSDDARSVDLPATESRRRTAVTVKEVR